MPASTVEVVNPESLAHWRAWLHEHHQTKEAVWLVFYKKASPRFRFSWSEAVDVALCFGWIDSKKIAVDAEASHQFFSKRKAGSTWSKINKQKVAVLMEKGLMTEAGLAAISLAKSNGSWHLLDSVDALEIPPDLETAFARHAGAKAYFQSLSKSTQKALLQWIVLAKQPATKQARIHQIAACAAQKTKPKPF